MGAEAAPTPTPAPPVAPQFFHGFKRLPPGRHDVAGEEVARQQRERLMAAMLGAVGEQTYITTSVADVIRRAEVSRRTFYEHFSDKEDCFLKSYDHVTAILAATIRTACPPQTPWRDALRTGLTVVLCSIAVHPRLARACLVGIHAVGPEGIRRRTAELAPFERFFAEGRGEARPDAVIPATVAETLVGGILETIAARVMRDEAHGLPDLLDDLVYWSLMPFVGPEAAAAAARPRA